MTASEHFTKFVPVTVAGVDKRRLDDAERRGAHHTSWPAGRGRESEPYTSGATTSAGSTDAARIDDGISDDKARDQYPRGRRRPRDNQSLGKRLDVHIRGKDSHAKVIAVLQKHFPGRPWHTVGSHFVITGKDAHRRVMECISELGGKVTHVK
jgi:hypothetical protein